MSTFDLDALTNKLYEKLEALAKEAYVKRASISVVREVTIGLEDGRSFRTHQPVFWIGHADEKTIFYKNLTTGSTKHIDKLSTQELMHALHAIASELENMVNVDSKQLNGKLSGDELVRFEGFDYYLTSYNGFQ